MTHPAVPARLRELLADVFELSAEHVTPALSVGQVERWDSIGHLQAVLALESEFGIQFQPETIPELTSVAHIQRELERLGVVLG